MIMSVIKKKIKSLYKKYLPTIYPNRCPFCRCTIPPDDFACESCKKDIPVHGYFQGVNGGFMCCSPLLYRGKSRRAVLNFKFRKKTQYSKHFAKLIYIQIQKSYPDFIFDYITYVPMYYKDERKRGFNQSQLLAKELSILMEIPCISTIEKIKRTQHQHHLSASKRRKNLKGAFKVIDKTTVKGKHILLIDDIITTGTTLHECSKALEKAKPSQICCATILSTAYLY